MSGPCHLIVPPRRYNAPSVPSERATSDSSSTPRIASSPLRPLNLALNLEDDEEQEILDDPLAVQTEVIELSSQKSPVWEFFDKTEDRGKANNKDCPMQF